MSPSIARMRCAPAPSSRGRGWPSISPARDALTALFDRFSGVFQIQPTHNAVGLFDADGSYDERSDRQQTLRELVELGAEDAQRQVIDPVLGASGDELERAEAARPTGL